MRIRDLISLSTRMFRTRATRTWLTILGISIGISAVLFLVALGYGLQGVILQKIVFNEALLSLTVTPANDVLPFNDQSIQDISHIDRVSEVAPQASFSGQAIYGQLHGTVSLHAVDAPFFDYAGVVASDGALYSADDTDKVVVSQAVLRLFGIEDDAAIIGQSIQLELDLAENSTSTQSIVVPHPFTVVGVIEDEQESYVYAPLKEISKFASTTKYDQIRVKVATDKDLAGVQGAIINQGYQVASLSDTIDQANKIFQVVQVVLGLFGTVALVVSAIGMFNTMTVTLLERTNEIGIMRAIGAFKPDVRNMFLMESMIIGFFGGLVGELLGFVFAWLFNFGINSLAAHFGGASINLFYFPKWFLVAIILISLIIGFFSGIFPARRAANLEPLEALRYK